MIRLYYQNSVKTKKNKELMRVFSFLFITFANVNKNKHIADLQLSWLEQQTHNLEVPGSSPGWSTKRFQKDVKQHVILAFKTRIIAVKSRFYSDFLFFIHIRLTAKLYLLMVIIRSFSATEIATQKQALKKMQQ